MAVFQLGEGEGYDGHVVAMKSIDDNEPAFVEIVCRTERGDDQKNFPVTIMLLRNEAIKLIAGLAEALAPTLPKAERCDTGPIAEEISWEEIAERQERAAAQAVGIG